MIALILFLFTLIYSNHSTTISILKDKFYLNGQITNQGTSSSGLLLNSRMIQALFDDSNPSTQTLWRYPDTHQWDPNRNVHEFISNLTTYRNYYGLNAVTVGFQGGGPYYFPNNTYPWVVSGWTPSGEMDPEWASRLTQVLNRADELNMVVIVSLFYIQQEYRLNPGDNTILQAVGNAVDFLKGFRNVLLEIANESNENYTHACLRPENIHTVIDFAKTRSNSALLVSTSFYGGISPPDAVLQSADHITLHGNGLTSDEISHFITQVQANPIYQKQPKPIIFNEDGTDSDHLFVAVGHGASWGYYDQGTGDYLNGFQTPPVNWKISTPLKTAFFNGVKQFT